MEPHLPDIPAEWDHLASKAAGMGPLQEDYRIRPWRLLLRVTAPLFVLAGIALLGLAAWESSEGFREFCLGFWEGVRNAHGRRNPFRRSRVILLGGLFILVLGIGHVLASVRRLRNWGRRVLVFAEGFVYLDGRRLWVYRWDEIAAVRPQEVEGFFARRFKGPYSLTIRPYEGENLVFNAYFPNVRKLASRAEAASLKSRLARDPSPEGEASAAEDRQAG